MAARSVTLATVHRLGAAQVVRISATSGPSPRANAITERWAGSARRERLDRMMIASERHLRLVLGEYVGHYNTHPLHRAVHQEPPAGRDRLPN